MNKSLMTGIGIGVVVAAAAGAVASLSIKGDAPRASNLEQSAPLGEDPDEAAAGSAATEGTLASNETTSGSAAGQAATAAALAAPAARSTERSAGRAGAGSADSAPRFARVVASTPVVETERVAREACHDEQVTRQKPVKDEKRVAGAALGAVIGGVLGNQVGDGDGQKLATAAGAIAGGVAGSKIQKRMQQGNTETVTEKRCETVYDTKEKTVGYDVRYRVGDSVQTARMKSDPGVGAQLPLQGGRLIAQTGAKARETT